PLAHLESTESRHLVHDREAERRLVELARGGNVRHIQGGFQDSPDAGHGRTSKLVRFGTTPVSLAADPSKPRRKPQREISFAFAGLMAGTRRSGPGVRAGGQMILRVSHDPLGRQPNSSGQRTCAVGTPQRIIHAYMSLWGRLSAWAPSRTS